VDEESVSLAMERERTPRSFEIGGQESRNRGGDASYMIRTFSHELDMPILNRQLYQVIAYDYACSQVAALPVRWKTPNRCGKRQW